MLYRGWKQNNCLITAIPIIATHFATLYNIYHNNSHLCQSHLLTQHSHWTRLAKVTSQWVLAVNILFWTGPDARILEQEGLQGMISVPWATPFTNVSICDILAPSTYHGQTLVKVRVLHKWQAYLITLDPTTVNHAKFHTIMTHGISLYYHLCCIKSCSFIRVMLRWTIFI